MAKESTKITNQLIVQIKKSYAKVTVGITIWKQVMVTSLLFGKSVLVAVKSTIEKIKRYVTIAALRGEIGASRMESRIMESMLMYARETLIGNF